MNISTRVLNIRFVIRVIWRFMDVSNRLCLWFLIWRIIGGQWLLTFLFYETIYYLLLFWRTKNAVYLEGIMGYICETIKFTTDWAPDKVGYSFDCLCLCCASSNEEVELECHMQNGAMSAMGATGAIDDYDSSHAALVALLQEVFEFESKLNQDTALEESVTNYIKQYTHERFFLYLMYYHALTTMCYVLSLFGRHKNSDIGSITMVEDAVIAAVGFGILIVAFAVLMPDRFCKSGIMRSIKTICGILLSGGRVVCVFMTGNFLWLWWISSGNIC